MPEIDRREKVTQRYPFIAVVGPVGIGKTTFTELVADGVSITQLQEPYKENPYLNNFYTKNPVDYSFDCQMFFMSKDGVQTKKIPQMLKNGPILRDAGGEMNYLIERVQWKMGWMTDEEHGAYVSSYNNVFKDALNPDVYIALKASENTVIERIIKRGWEMELTFMEKHPDYFLALVWEFDIWLEKKLKDRNNCVAVIDTNSFDFTLGGEEKNNIVREVVNRSGYFLAAPTQRNMVGSDGARLIVPNTFMPRPNLNDRVPGATKSY